LLIILKGRRNGPGFGTFQLLSAGGFLIRLGLTVTRLIADAWYCLVTAGQRESGLEVAEGGQGLAVVEATKRKRAKERAWCQGKCGMLRCGADKFPFPAHGGRVWL